MPHSAAATSTPYLACAAQLAAGLSGIEEGLSWMPPVTGDVYGMEDVPSIPTPARGDRNLAQLCHAQKDDGRLGRRSLYAGAEVEQEAFDAAVTDWEIARGFERA
jgi:glutamine synthetase